jgi:hypothetical protein
MHQVLSEAPRPPLTPSDIAKPAFCLVHEGPDRDLTARENLTSRFTNHRPRQWTSRPGLWLLLRARPDRNGQHRTDDFCGDEPDSGREGIR